MPCSCSQMSPAFVECPQKWCLTTRCMVGFVDSDSESEAGEDDRPPRLFLVTEITAVELRDRELWIKAKWLYANGARGGEEWMRYVPTDEKLGLLLDEFTTKEANRIFPGCGDGDAAAARAIVMLRLRDHAILERGHQQERVHSALATLQLTTRRLLRSEKRFNIHIARKFKTYGAPKRTGLAPAVRSRRAKYTRYARATLSREDFTAALGWGTERRRVEFFSVKEATEALGAMQLTDPNGCVRLLCPIGLYIGSNATHNGVKVFEKLSLVIPLELANPWVGIGGDDSEPLYNCIVVKTSGLVTIRRRDIQMDIPVVAKSISSQVVGMSGGVVRIAGPGAVEALARFRGGGPLRRLARGPAAYVQ